MSVLLGLVGIATSLIFAFIDDSPICGITGVIFFIALSIYLTYKEVKGWV